jgi:hypothetical protein
VADLIILAVLLILLLFELYSHAAINIAEEISTFVLIARYGLQLYRIGTLVWQSKEAGLLHKLEDIRLDDLDVNDEIEGYRFERKEPKAH